MNETQSTVAGALNPATTSGMVWLIVVLAVLGLVIMDHVFASVNVGTK